MKDSHLKEQDGDIICEMREREGTEKIQALYLKMDMETIDINQERLLEYTWI